MKSGDDVLLVVHTSIVGKQTTRPPRLPRYWSSKYGIRLGEALHSGPNDAPDSLCYASKLYLAAIASQMRLRLSSAA
jgi:hypothetical protein